MALVRSLFSGVTGLINHQTMMDVIGNNIANVNTIGFKGSRVTFADTFNLYARYGADPAYNNSGENIRGGQNAFQIGLGSTLGSIDRDMRQGTFERTNITSDLALEGEGMFVLKRGGAGSERLYTRAGNFIFDADGNFVNPSNGLKVQGKLANAKGVIPPGNKTEDIIIDPLLRISATPTTETEWAGNLQSDSSITRTQMFEQSGNISTSNEILTAAEFAAIDLDLQTEMMSAYNIDTVYDDDGSEFTFRVDYFRTGENEFEFTQRIFDSSGALVNGPVESHTATFVTQAEVDAARLAQQGDPTVKIPVVGQMYTIDGDVLPLGDNGYPELPSFSPTPVAGDPNYDLYTSLRNLLPNTSSAFTFDPTNVTLSENINSLNSLVDGGRVPNIVSGSLTIYDSLGNTHALTLTFTKLADNFWRWRASVPESAGTTSGDVGTLSFNNDGSIDWGGVAPSPPIVNFLPNGGADPQSIELDFGEGFTGITQTSAESVLSNLTQNGNSAATLQNVSIDQFGIIEGIFSNGTSKHLAQVMVATFPNSNGLVSIGDNLYRANPNSGIPFFGEPGETTQTYVNSGALEQSNVDLSEEFTRMIIAQRGFQSNARVITTSDQLIQEITNLVR